MNDQATTTPVTSVMLSSEEHVGDIGITFTV